MEPSFPWWLPQSQCRRGLQQEENMMWWGRRQHTPVICYSGFLPRPQQGVFNCLLAQQVTAKTKRWQVSCKGLLRMFEFPPHTFHILNGWQTWGVKQPSTRTAGFRHWVMSKRRSSLLYWNCIHFLLGKSTCLTWHPFHTPGRSCLLGEEPCGIKLIGIIDKTPKLTGVSICHFAASWATTKN